MLAFAVDVTELVSTRRAAWTTAAWRTERLQAMTAALSKRSPPRKWWRWPGEGALAMGALTGLVVVPEGTSLDVFEFARATHGFAPGELEGWQRFEVSATCPPLRT